MTKSHDARVLVCCGTGCRANGALDVADAMRRALEENGLSKESCSTSSEAGLPPGGGGHRTDLRATGCNGFCENGPIVKVTRPGAPFSAPDGAFPDAGKDVCDITYYHVKPGDAQDIVRETILNGKPVERLLYKDDDGRPVLSQDDNPFYKAQLKAALRHIGVIDPEDIDDFLSVGGYNALRKALKMTPEEIVSEVEASGLRGRGGAGFPTGRKWRTAMGFDNFPKYVVCNGDEGDPGAFMDRSILEGDPHSVIEGLAIAALAVGAEEGFFYIRDEYDLAVRHVRKAIEDAEACGVIGESVMGSGRKLKLSVVRGGGAFICGESTALMASIEGRVGEPRAKYIRSVQRGLWDQPTALNNVETLANVPLIIERGGPEFAKVGTGGSSGTKVFALVGKVKRTGLVEVPMGATLRHIIFDIGGGVAGDRPFKAVQTGGPSGGCIPAPLLDLEVDFDNLTKYGAMMGSGGMIVMDDRSCMVEVARYYVNFLCEESCGKCTPCREGLRRMREILTDICEGRGKPGDIELLEKLGRVMQDASLCSLGKSAPNPVLTTIKYFGDEYRAHIEGHSCPAGVCRQLTSFSIDGSKCTGCHACARACPAGAVTGEPRSPHRIDRDRCIVCGSCREACRFSAVITGPREAAL